MMTLLPPDPEPELEVGAGVGTGELEAASSEEATEDGEDVE